MRNVKKKVLIIGSGGREHALCWKIAQSSSIGKLYAAPGNGGISQIAECVDIQADDIPSLLKFAKEKAIDLTVVGPEAPLVLGIADDFRKQGLRIFAPDKYSAQLEGSKVFAKEQMARFSLPTADFRIFDDPIQARDYLKHKKPPIVIKVDGLAAGKGVIVAQTEDEALSAIDTIMVDKMFGPAGDRVIIEDCLVGEEASVIVVSDGGDFVTFASSQDHKRIFDGDEGPNTGGMGAYSPAPVVTEELEKKIEDEIIAPLINGLAKQGTPCQGVLYLGLMITEGTPYILEFNARFGDPETQAILPRLNTDLVDIMEASIDKRIRDIKLEWKEDACVCVVCSSAGYPGSYKKGLPMRGLEEAAGAGDALIFHAGTKLTHSAAGGAQYETNGGRVLGVTALGDDIGAATERAYAACSKIEFEGIHYRKDIGHRAINRKVT